MYLAIVQRSRGLGTSVESTEAAAVPGPEARKRDGRSILAALTLASMLGACRGGIIDEQSPPALVPSPTQAQWEQPQAAIIGENGGTVIFVCPDGQSVTLDLAAGALAPGSQIVFTWLGQAPSGLPSDYHYAGISFELSIIPPSGARPARVPSTEFAAAVTMEVAYAEQDWPAAGYPEAALDLYYHYEDGSYASVAQECCGVDGQQDTSVNSVTVSLCHASEFILVGLG